MPTQMHCPNPTCRALVVASDGRCQRCGHTFTLAQPTRAPSGLPAVIGRYQVRELLGAGSFGSVYRAFDPKLEREVALKVLKAEMTAAPEAVKRFLREAKAAAKLRHAHIVAVFDADRAGDHYYIASAFIQGRTLASAITEGGVEPRRAAEWTAQLASALGYAHKKGLVHRDVKPANAMLDEEDALQLMDFGLAGWTQEESAQLTQTGAVMGTPAYMSPEQAGGDTANIGPRSDLYSAGVVLYKLLTGRLPFQGGHVSALPYQIIHVAPPRPSEHRPGLDAGLEAICLKALAKDPAKRYQSGAEMATALRAWTPTGLQAAKPPPPLDCTGEKGANAAEVRRAQQAWAKYLGREVEVEDEIAPGVKMRFVLVPPGKFLMGSPGGEKGRSKDEVLHEVELTHPIYLGVYDVTQGQYEAVTGKNPSKFKGTDLPVEMVSWEEADAFARKLTEKAQGGLMYRLPTEAEWEYTSRGGRPSSSPFGIGDGTSLFSLQANFDGNYPYGGADKGPYLEKTTPVGTYPANALGLYDMQGNVWQWCADVFGDYPPGRVVDPTGPAGGSSRVRRGGSWFSDAGFCRAAYRSGRAPGNRFNGLGFRLAQVLPSGQGK